ncbi:MAG: outer membrane protein assembly factor BamD [Candidatus Omnitrophica bacterium]|nr:outer membrane protein assembly factor BamD [Candidatus Omnitrophota bacterium]
MKKSLFILIIVYTFSISYQAEAFWVWSPKTKKLINPKYAAKDNPEEQYKWAMRFFKKKEYTRAAEEFSLLTTHFKDSDLAPEAQYYAGRSYEEAGKPYPAFVAYQKTIDVYPFTKRIDEIIEREYNLGRTLYKKHSGKLMGKELMTDLDRAAEIFKIVRENAPFGVYADKAQFMLGQCHKKSEQYNEAITAFQQLVDEYAKSNLAEKARYEVAQCTYLASLKSDYDQELTDEAIEEFKKVAMSRSGGVLTEEAKEAVSLLENKKAESLFKTAQFYEKQKHYKSAVIYYKEVLNRYPRSSSSKSAMENLGKIEMRFKQEAMTKESELDATMGVGKAKKPWISFE